MLLECIFGENGKKKNGYISFCARNIPEEGAFELETLLKNFLRSQDQE
jgi:hypothetical protein